MVDTQLILDEIVEQLHDVNGLYQISQGTVKSLRNQLCMSKLFLNMVIHDCRNPTASIKLGLILIMGQMNEIKQITLDQIQFGDESNKLALTLKQNLKKLTKGNRNLKMVRELTKQIQEQEDSMNESFENFKTMLDDFSSKQNQQHEGQIEYEDFQDDEMDESEGITLFSENRKSLRDMEIHSKESLLLYEKRKTVKADLKLLMVKN